MTKDDAIRELGEDKYSAVTSARMSWVDSDEVWVSPASGKAFFQNWLKDNSLERIWKAVRDPKPGIYFRAGPTPQVMDRINRLLGVQAATK